MSRHRPAPQDRERLVDRLGAAGGIQERGVEDPLRDVLLALVGERVDAGHCCQLWGQVVVGSQRDVLSELLRHAGRL